MKIDANVKMKKDSVGILTTGQTINVPVDLDYCDDYDDVIKAVEAKIYEDFKVFLFNEIDFTIENAPEICSSL